MAQEIKAKNAVMKGGKVKPNDDVVVYATGKLKSTHKEGEEMTVHSAIAEKLISSGKATAEAPKGAKK